jgi:S-adenosylmethionine:tRNA ribosyltransferase-isomerase
MVDDDLRWYQTVYADRPGSVAAPTAGLHLTELLLRQLRAQSIGLERVTLHVGMGTFRPIAVSNLDEHKMHSEWGEIQAPAVDALREARAAGGRVVAVGTTSVRVLESAAAAGTLQPWSGHTDLFIRPGFRFHATDALLTNFHLPRSSLLVLVSAFAGRSLIQQAYREAIRERYRFFSYGDAMLIR